ncbi:hypothetical protein JXA84_05315 [candidate division WOR-3 bacterium]|nr:hypothetical protein [candidate division WOR-3 bacterium]
MKIILFALTLLSTNLFSSVDPFFSTGSIDPFDKNYLETIGTDVEGLKAKALEYYRQGDYENAARYYISTVSHSYDDAVSLYNLACCYGLLGNAEFAARCLQLSVRAGFQDTELIRGDTDFENVLSDTLFVKTRDSLLLSIEISLNSEGNQIWFEVATFLDSRVYYPPYFNPETGFNLIVGLHGFGGNPESFLKLVDRFKDRNFIFICPRAPYLAYPGRIPGYGWFLRDDSRPEYWDNTLRTSVNYVCDVTEKVKSYYNIEKTFLMGFSQGCGLAYMAGLTNPEMYDGLICFGGWLDTSFVTPEQISSAEGKVEIFIAHGLNDRVVEIKNAREAFEILDSHGFDVTLFEFDGAHSVPEEAVLQAENWIHKKR